MFRLGFYAGFVAMLIGGAALFAASRQLGTAEEARALFAIWLVSLIVAAAMVTISYFRLRFESRLRSVKQNTTR